MTTVVFALVHYRNTGPTKEAIARIRALDLPNAWAVDVIVADNSGDAPADIGAPVVSDGSNRGYLGGAALAFDRWRAEHGRLPSWFVIMNPDAEPQRNALLALERLSLPNDVAIVAPSVLLDGATPQNPFLSQRPSRARMWIYTIAFRHTVLSRAFDLLLDVKRNVIRRAPRTRDSRTIYAPHGSIVFLRSTFFERGGNLEYRGFMFGEEIHLAEQVRRLGVTVLFVPTVEVVHRGGSTTGRVDAARRREWHRASAVVLWEDYFR